MIKISNIVAFFVLNVIIYTFCHDASAQRRYRYWSFGPTLGTCHYQGDLDDNGFDFWANFQTGSNRNQGNPAKLIRPGIGFMANYHFHPHMFFRFSVMQGWIGADDGFNQVESRKSRNLNFRTPITEASAQIVYEFFAVERHYRYRPNWSPYVFSGIAVYRYNPKTNIKKIKEAFPGVFDDYPNFVALHPLGTEGQLMDNPNNGYYDASTRADFKYNLTQFSVPIGVGLRRKVNHRTDLRFEVGLRKTFTDYLDDVSGPLYANPDQFGFVDFNNIGQNDSQRLLARILSDPSLVYSVNQGRAAGNSPTTPGYTNIDMIPTSGRGRYNAQQAIPGEVDKALRVVGGGGELRGNRELDDWYAFLGLSLTIILDKQDRCPYFR